MMPLRLIWVNIKKYGLGSLLVVGLIAIIVAFGLFITLQERALREGSARAAEQFDLIIGGAGSETQLVLSTVYLQPSPLPLLDSHYLTELTKNPQVAWAAPIALGDSYFNSPIIGTTPVLLSQDNKIHPHSGRFFSKKHEAVVGANTGLKLGDKITPIHGQAGQFDAYAHTDINYTIVGILPPQNNAWDKAIFVPIESVWDIHGLGETHVQHTDEHASDTHSSPPISAIIVKPKSFAAAYQLRSHYKQTATQAVFPVEVLTKLYGTLGHIQQVLTKVSFVSQLLVALILMMITLIYFKLKQQQIAVLRAFGASRRRIFFVIWLGLMLMVGIGLLLGALLGYGATLWVSHQIYLQQGFPLPVNLQTQDIMQLLILLAILSVSLVIPATLTYRQSVASCFK